jgi:hypothetical protein
MKKIFFLLLLLSLPLVAAANNPGHDSLYIEQTGDSNLTGTLNISDELRVANLFYSDNLDIMGNGSQPGNNKAEIYATAGNAMYFNAPGNFYFGSTGGGTMVYMGTSGVHLNVSGDIYAGNTLVQKRVSGTCGAGEAIATIDANGGVTCVDANATGVSTAGGWTNTSSVTSTSLDVNINSGDFSVMNGNLTIGNNKLIIMPENEWGDKWHFAGSDIKVSMDNSATAWQWSSAGTTGLDKFRWRMDQTGGIGELLDLEEDGEAHFYGYLTVDNNITVSGKIYAEGNEVCTAGNGLCGGASAGGGWFNTSTTTSTSLIVDVTSDGTNNILNLRNSSSDTVAFFDKDGRLSIGVSSLGANANIQVADGIRIGTHVSAPWLFPYSGTGYNILNSSGRNLGIWSSTTSGGNIGLGMSGDGVTASSGEFTHVQIVRSFEPTSGTGEYVHLHLKPAITQTGGADGRTVNLLLQPSIVNAPDYYSIFSSYGRNLLKAGDTAVAQNFTPLIVRGTASQIANLTEWQDNGGSVLSYVDASGDIFAQDGQVCTASNGLCGGASAGGGWTNTSTVTSTSLDVNITSRGSTAVPVTISGASGQSANLTEWKDNTGATLAYINANGDIVSGLVTIGAAAGKITLNTGGVELNGGGSINFGGGAKILQSGTNMDFTGNIVPTNSGDVGLTVQGVASQSANLQEWQDSNSDVGAAIDENGQLGIGISDPAYAIDVNGTSNGQVRFRGHTPTAFITGRRISGGGIAFNIFTAQIENNVTTADMFDIGVLGALNQGSTPTLSYGFIGQAYNDAAITWDSTNHVGIGAVGNAVAQLEVEGTVAGEDVLVLRGADGQTANLQEWQDNTSSVLGYVDASGDIFVGGSKVCTPANGLCGGASAGGGWTNTSTVTSTSLDVNITSGNLTVVNGFVGIGTDDPNATLTVASGGKAITLDPSLNTPTINTTSGNLTISSASGYVIINIG